MKIIMLSPEQELSNVKYTMYYEVQRSVSCNKGPIKISVDAVAREKSICYNSARVLQLDQIWTIAIGS